MEPYQFQQNPYTRNPYQVNENGIANEAHALENELMQGRTNVLAEQLHSMPPQERMAVARQIQVDEEAASRNNPLLPQLHFTQSGDVKSVDEPVPHGYAHVEYNPAIARAESSDVVGFGPRGAFIRHEQFDPSGRIISGTEVDGLGTNHPTVSHAPQVTPYGQAFR